MHYKTIMFKELNRVNFDFMLIFHEHWPIHNDDNDAIIFTHSFSATSDDLNSQMSELQPKQASEMG